MQLVRRISDVVLICVCLYHPYLVEAQEPFHFVSHIDMNKGQRFVFGGVNVPKEAVSLTLDTEFVDLVNQELELDQPKQTDQGASWHVRLKRISQGLSAKSDSVAKLFLENGKLHLQTENAPQQFCNAILNSESGDRVAQVFLRKVAPAAQITLDLTRNQQRELVAIATCPKTELVRLAVDGLLGLPGQTVINGPNPIQAGQFVDLTTALPQFGITSVVNVEFVGIENGKAKIKLRPKYQLAGERAKPWRFKELGPDIGQLRKKIAEFQATIANAPGALNALNIKEGQLQNQLKQQLKAKQHVAAGQTAHQITVLRKQRTKIIGQQKRANKTLPKTQDALKEKQELQKAAVAVHNLAKLDYKIFAVSGDKKLRLLE